MGVDANGWPTNVAANELIESAWGNAVVKSVLYVPVGMGVLRVGPHIQAAIGNVLHNPVTPVVAYATRMFAQASVFVGSDSTSLSGITAAIIATAAGGNQPVTPPLSPTAAGGQYGHVALNWSWLVPANADPSYAVTAQWTTGGGAIYTATDTTWQRYRA